MLLAEKKIKLITSKTISVISGDKKTKGSKVKVQYVTLALEAEIVGSGGEDRDIYFKSG